MSASALLLAARIASLNLCTDEYLLLLARPGEIASVSFLSHDPRETPLWKRARAHPANAGSIEGVLKARPTQLLTMGGGGRGTRLIAGRMGIGTVDLPPAETPADVASNLRKVAAALGDPARANPWLKRLQQLAGQAPRTATDAIWVSSGGTSLSPHSAGAAWMRLAGLRQRALPGDRATLETLLTEPPSVLVQSNYRAGQHSRGAAWLKHPIVREARSRRLATDGRAWTCMGPLMIPEIERLQASTR